MNRQQIINTVIGRLLKQGDFAFDGQRCQYLVVEDDRRRKCAAGILMTDEECEACDAIGQASWTDINDEHPNLIPTPLRNQASIINTLQICHDVGAADGRVFVDHIVYRMGELT